MHQHIIGLEVNSIIGMSRTSLAVRFLLCMGVRSDQLITPSLPKLHVCSQAPIYRMVLPRQKGLEFLSTVALSGHLDSYAIDVSK